MERKGDRRIGDEVYNQLEKGQLEGYVEGIISGDIKGHKIQKVQNGIDSINYTNKDLKEFVKTGIKNKIEFYRNFSRCYFEKMGSKNDKADNGLEINERYLKNLENGESIVIDGVEFNFD